jgi:hypothetical protein
MGGEGLSWAPNLAVHPLSLARGNYVAAITHEQTDFQFPPSI